MQSKGLPRVFSNTSSKASILWRSAFFIIQLLYSYMTTGKTIALTIWTLVNRAMSLLFNILSRLVIVFLPRSKCLLISRLQSPSAEILEPKKIKSVTVSLFPHLFALLSFCVQSFPTSGSFPMNQLFKSCGQSIGVSVSASVLPMNNQD